LNLLNIGRNIKSWSFFQEGVIRQCFLLTVEKRKCRRPDPIHTGVGTHRQGYPEKQGGPYLKNLGDRSSFISSVQGSDENYLLLNRSKPGGAGK